MEWVALLFFLARPRRERSVDILVITTERVTSASAKKERQPPWGARQKGRLAASLARCSPLQGCASLVPCHPSLLPPRAIRSNFSRVSQAAHFGL